MRFGNRWVPMEVMNMVFILWAIAALIILALIIWIAYFPPQAKPKDPVPSGRSGKRTKRRKR